MAKKNWLWVAGLLLLLAAGSGRLFSFPLWLDAPARSNPNDPRGINYTPWYLPTNSPQATATPRLTATPTATPSSTPNGTLTNTPTASPSPTPTASFTSTPGVLIYDGDVSGHQVGTCGGCLSVYPTDNSACGAEVAGAGPQGGSHYIQFDAQGKGGEWSDKVTFYGSAANATGTNVVSLWIKIPSAAVSSACTTWTASCQNEFEPAIELMTAIGYPYDHSVAVTITPYLVGTNELLFDQWVQAIIPVAAFEGINDSSVTFTAAALASINGFTLMAWNTGTNGVSTQGMFAFNSYGSTPQLAGGMTNNRTHQAFIDKVALLQLSSGVPPVSSVGAVFDDFENQNANLWNGGPWQVEFDSDTCTPATSITFPNVAASVHAYPIDNGGNSLSSCHAAHFAGTLGETSYACGTSWAVADINTYLSPGGWNHSIDLSNTTTIPMFMPNGAKGIRMAMKSNLSIGQSYAITIGTLTTVAAGYNYWFFSVADNDAQGLTTNWKMYDVPFPTGTAATGSGQVEHTGNASTELWWGQAPYWGPGTYVNWTQNDMMQIKIKVMQGAKQFDLWVDDISFY